MHESTASLHAKFISRFGGDPRVFISPGRINIIGEHTDYNEGFVLPAGIDRYITMLIDQSTTSESCLISIDSGESVTFTDATYHEVTAEWARYVIGVYDQLKKSGYEPGPVNCMFTGNIPMGAGLSSSAALECVSLAAYSGLFNFNLEKKELALMAQKAENEFVGVNCGIMDQFASVFSRVDNVIKLDCRDLTYDYFPLQLGEYELLLVDSQVKHSLASSEYNTRRQQCEAGLEILNEVGYEVSSLRHVTREILDSQKQALGPTLYRRCKYVIDEMERVNKACLALEKNNLDDLGRLLYETHAGLRDEYSVSCSELDFLVDKTLGMPYVLGARMMGGGFGGCTINLVSGEQKELFISSITEAYQKEYLKEALVYEVKISNGTTEVETTEINQ